MFNYSIYVVTLITTSDNDPNNYDLKKEPSKIKNKNTRKCHVRKICSLYLFMKNVFPKENYKHCFGRRLKFC